MKRLLSHLIPASLLILLILPFRAHAEYTLDWKAEVDINAGSGEFAPYFIASNSGGIFTQPAGAFARAAAWRDLDKSKRFSYSFGADLVAGWSEPTDYLRWQPETSSFIENPQRQSAGFVQQLWGEVKWRGVFLSAGMRENNRSIFNSELGSGDLALSNNARPIPQVRVGFIDFQNIPFTNGWVQIQGEIAYGKFTDSKWLENHFNYYSSFITTGTWFHYKRCYFRTNPEARFSATVGMQTAAQFGGRVRRYMNGNLTATEDYKVKFSDFTDIFFQKEKGNSVYYNGNTLGTWDLRLRYRFRNDWELTAYMQSPWEDGSGIGKLNGFDGVWGLELHTKEFPWLSEVVAEYIDFTNQGGPIHWSPADSPGTGVPGHATGADNYYNNYMYNSWTNYGMTLGTPFIPGTIYNTDGYLRITDNRLRGFHIGAKGLIKPGLTYRVLVSYRRSLGSQQPRLEPVSDTSAMIEANYAIRRIPGLSVSGKFAFDAGKLLGNNFGVFASLTYTGKINFK